MTTQRKAFNATEIVTHLTLLNGERAKSWRYLDGALDKQFEFKNFYETMAFVNAVAFIANQQDHHPDLQVSYKACVVRYNSHDVQGISQRDFDCAARIDALST